MALTPRRSRNRVVSGSPQLSETQPAVNRGSKKPKPVGYNLSVLAEASPGSSGSLVDALPFLFFAAIEVVTQHETSLSELFLLGYIRHRGQVVDPSLKRPLPALPFSHLSDVLIEARLFSHAGGVSNFVTSIVEKGLLAKVWVATADRKRLFSKYGRTHTVIQITRDGISKLEQVNAALDRVVGPLLPKTSQDR